MSGQEQAELFTASDVARATGGRVVAGNPQRSCSGVASDSRILQPGQLFVALRGERFDGADFAAQAVARGAALLLLEEAALAAGKLAAFGEAAVIAVPDAWRALGDLAAWHRRRLPARVVGITGSNGKTSTKQMTAAVLEVGGEVLATEGNLNNQIGLPLCLLRLRRRHKYAVLEMGMNAPGEIARLAEIAGPQIGLVTNVGPVHLEGLGSLEAVARAKAELIQSLGAEGVAVLNADDARVLEMGRATAARRVTFGKNPGAAVRILAASQTLTGAAEARLEAEGRPLEIRLEHPGVHNAYNAAAALAVALAEGLDLEAAAQRLSRIAWPKLRMETVVVGHGRLLVDCYNSNPRSLHAALETLKALAGDGPSWAVLGDMRELGQQSERLHREMGALAARLGLAGLCAFGSLAALMAEAAAAAGMADTLATESIEAAAAWAAERLRRGGWLLVKGSRAMRLERVVEALSPPNDRRAEG